MPLNPLPYKLIDQSHDFPKTLDLDPIINIDPKERLGLGKVSITLPLKDFNNF
jgi:hypothetical protein